LLRRIQSERFAPNRLPLPQENTRQKAQVAQRRQ
jgi:hypothetical protein